MIIEQIKNTLPLLITIIIIYSIVTLVKWVIHLINSVGKGVKKTSQKAVNKIYNDGYNSRKNRNRKQDLDKILLHAKMHIRIPKSDYNADRPEYTRFIRSPYHQEYLNEFTNHILKYIDYRGNIPDIQYGILNNKLSTHTFDRQKVSITINSSKRTPEELVAIIIRECVHLYMFDNHIDYAPEYLPEQNADVYAIYLGFYNILTNGYQKIGFLNETDMKYIKKQIEKY